MFGTLKCSASEKQPKLIEFADGAKFFEAGIPHRSACQACRERKLRCEGQKPTCERCRIGGIQCQYVLSNVRRHRKGIQRGADKQGKNAKEAYLPNRDTFKAVSPVSAVQRLNPDCAFEVISESIPQSPARGRSNSHDATENVLLNAQSELEYPHLSSFIGLASDHFPEELSRCDAMSSNEWIFHVDETMEENSPNSLCGKAAGLLTPLSFDSQVHQSAPTGMYPHSKCDCVEKTLECLDDLERLDCLEQRASGLNLPRITSEMNLQRRAWKQCQTLLSCQECQLKPSNMTLLMLSYERIVDFCDRAYTEYLGRRPHIFGKNLLDVRIGDYKMESQKECLAILQTLMDLRLEEMTSDIRQMRSGDAAGVKDLHIVRLQAAEEKLKDIAVRLRYR